MQTSTPPIATPCVQVCIVDGASGLCLGCFRTLAEIGGWSAMDAAGRAAVIAQLPARRRRIAPEKLALIMNAKVAGSPFTG